MMKTRDWKDTAELIGIAAIVASLIFVGLQMKQAQEIADAERRMMRIANTIELTNAINEHSDVWARGNAGEELDDAETVIFENLVLAAGDYFYMSSRAARSLGNEFGERSLMVNFARFLHKHPGARQVFSLEDEELWRYRAVLTSFERSSNAWGTLIQADLAKLDQNQN